ncbi:MAG: hypothetical protein SCH98_08700 [Deferrisomatales bacterium]|nr:hypothetical protein [Deferrisomatales bacterium]
MKLLVPWYSRTGTTGRVVRETRAVLERLGHTVTDVAIVPRRRLPYPLWLLLSFLPGSRVPVAGGSPDPAAFDGCLLALPKWTFSCPPVNAYLAAWGARLPPTAVVVTCGGWDQDRYLRALQRHLEGGGTLVRGGCAVRRRHVEDGSFAEPLAEFLGRVFSALPGNDGSP